MSASGQLGALIGGLSPDKRALLADLLRPTSEPIAIIGMSCRFPGGIDSPDALWDLLRDGRTVIDDLPHERWDLDLIDSRADGLGTPPRRRGALLGLSDVADFDTSFFGIPPSEASRMDPQQRIALEVAWETLEHAGLAVDALAGSASGVFVGISDTLYALGELRADPHSLADPSFPLGTACSVAIGRLAYQLDLRGPALAIDTACSSSLVALAMACQNLRSRACDLALAGGVYAVAAPDVFIASSTMGMLSPEGRCKTFDAGADGYAFGEGCGMLALKRLSDAEAAGDNVLAVIRGIALNHDGRSNGLTAPNGLAQQAVLERALADAGIAPHLVSYVEAHGSATPLGDPIEVEAVQAVLNAGRAPDSPLHIGSVKTNLGHTVCAAGVAGVIKTVLAMQHAAIPAHLNFEQPNPAIDWSDPRLRVPSSLTPWTPVEGRRIAGVSSFGISGTNAHVVIEAATAPTTASSPEQACVLPLSARSEPALEQIAGRLAAHLERHPELDLADVAYTLQVGRRAFGVRRAIVVDSREAAIHALRAGSIGGGDAELEALARTWESGADVTWPSASLNERRRRVPLPSYPFERQRLRNKSPRRSSDPAEWFYAPTWVEDPLRATAETTGGRCVVLMDRSGIGDQLVEQLERSGVDVVRVADDATGWLDSAPEHIVHLRSLDAHSGVTDYAGFERAQDLGFYSLLQIAQALGPKASETRLTVVTLGVQPVHGHVERPEQAPLAALARVISQEFPSIRCRVVDIDAASAPSLAAEIESDAAEPAVAYRDGTRFVERFEPCRWEGDAPLRKHGVYLITGGLGGIGRILAEHLARQYQARLVLVGRSSLTPDKQDFARHLETLGAEVLVASADVGDPTQLNRVLEQTQARFGALHGVFHAAGLTNPAAFRSLAEMDRDTCAAHFQPKVAGLLALQSALRTLPAEPDFCLLFSSTSAILGGIGFGAYAAANHFMDRFVHTGAASGRWLSVAWDVWQAGAADALPAGTSLASFAMTPEEGVRAVELALAAPNASMVQSRVDLHERLRQWVLLESLRSTPSSAVFEGTSEDLEKHIAAIWQESLGIDHIGLHENFFDLGGNSLIGLQIVARIQRELKLPVSVLLLFEAPTVDAFAKKLAAAPGSDKAVAKGAPRQRANDGIAVIAMAGRFPGANSVEQFWDNLCQGRESISFFSDAELEAEGLDPGLIREPNYIRARPIVDGADQFDAAFFRFSPREAELLDPQHRLFLECAWEAMELAGYDPMAYPGLVGVFAGSSLSTYLLNYWTDPRIVQSLDPFEAVIASDKDALPTTVSYKLNLRGPSVAVQTFCSTSLVATHMACQSLLDGECDMALAGGVSVRVPQKQGYLYSKGGQESPDGHCRTFDARAQGSLFGDGAGVVALKRLGDALADGDTIHAVIRGSAINNDGAVKVGYTAPSIAGQSAAVVQALDRAGVDAASIGYVEAHGTATPLGDPIEVASLTRAYRQFTDRAGFCAIGSAKTNVGHLDRAAGVTGLIKASLAVERGVIPATLHYETPNPELDLPNSPFYVADSLTRWEPASGPRRAAVNSLGVGGTNAHVILEQPPEQEPSGAGRGTHLLTLSASTPTALETATDNLAAFLTAHPHTSISDVAYTLAVGRHAFEHRRAVVCLDADDGARLLTARDARRVLTHQSAETERPVAFMFGGVGDQYPAMARELYDSEPVFREALDTCFASIQREHGLDLKQVLFDAATESSGASGNDLRALLRREPRQHASRLHDTDVAQPLVFAIEYALAQLLMRWGVQPRAMVGYSLGEYVAACVAGVLSLEDALNLVVKRARLIQSAPKGAMLVVMQSAEDVKPLLSDSVWLAIDNGPRTCVLAGTEDAIAYVQERLTREGLACQRLETTHAYHSPLLRPIAEQVTELARGVSLRPPRIPYISNVTGTWITDAQATDPAYWAQHMLGTVRFGDALDELLSDPERVLVEVGPGIALGSFARQHPRCSREQMSSIVPTLRAEHDRQSDVAVLLGSLARLWVLGVNPDWSAVYGHERRRRVPLPTYPFQRQRYWLAPGRSANPIALPEGSGLSEQLRALPRRPMDEWLYLPGWQQAPPAPPATNEAGWLVFAAGDRLSELLVTRLEESEAACVIVTAGSEYARVGPDRYVIRPDCRDDYVRLLRELRLGESRSLRIVHLWTLDAAGVDATLERGLYSLMHLAQAIGELGLRGCELSVVTAGACSVTGAERLVPARATSMGAARLFPIEYEDTACRCIDVEVASVSIDALLRELGAPIVEPLVALRSRTRWIESFAPVQAASPQPSRFRDGGVYLITGGLGGLGLALAEYLRHMYEARLVLVGRSGATTHVRQRVEALGAEVLVVAADVADPLAMRRVVDQTLERFGALNGVIHAAGVPGAGLVQNKTREEAASVLAAKVQGTLALTGALEDRGLNLDIDFLALFSSITSITGGGPGQYDYCAANAFLDAFAADGRVPSTVAINWGEWRWNAWEQGLANLPADLQAWMRSNRERIGIDFQEGFLMLERALAQDVPRLVVSTQPFGQLTELSRKFTVRAALDWQAPSGRSAARPAHPRPALSTPYVGPRDELEQRIARVWGEVLRIEQVGIDDNFFDLGGNSLIGLDLVTRLRRELQSEELPAHVVYEAPSVAALARLMRNQPADIAFIADRQVRGDRRRATLAQRHRQHALLGGRPS